MYIIFDKQTGQIEKVLRFEPKEIELKSNNMWVSIGAFPMDFGSVNTIGKYKFDIDLYRIVKVEGWIDYSNNGTNDTNSL